MIKFNLYLRDIIIPMPNIAQFCYTSDIFSLYNTATVTIKDMSSTIFNKVLIGTDVFIYFYDTDNTSDTTVVAMKVLSYKKTPSPVSSMVDDTTIQLISNWYFNSVIITKAHAGNTSSIIESIFQTQFPETSINILATDDLNTLRYQLGETSQAFMLRMCNYGIRDHLPVYLYSDVKGIVNLKGLSDFCKDAPQHLCITDTGIALTEDNISNLKSLRMINFEFLSENNQTHSITKTIFTTKHFIASKISNTAVTLSNSEIDNDQSEVYTPKKLAYMGWEYTPDDALSISLRRNFEDNIRGLYVFGEFNNFLLKELNVGIQVRIKLPFEKTIGIRSGQETNLGEDNYTIKKIDFTYSGNVYRTLVTLINT